MKENKKFYQVVCWSGSRVYTEGNFHKLENAKTYCKKHYYINSWTDISTDSFELQEGNRSKNTDGIIYIHECLFED